MTRTQVLPALALAAALGLGPAAPSRAQQADDMAWRPPTFSLPTVGTPSAAGTRALAAAGPGGGTTGAPAPAAQTPIPSAPAAGRSGVCLDTISLTASQRCLMCGIGCGTLVSQ